MSSTPTTLYRAFVRLSTEFHCFLFCLLFSLLSFCSGRLWRYREQCSTKTKSSYKILKSHGSKHGLLGNNISPCVYFRGCNYISCVFHEVKSSVLRTWAHIVPVKGSSHLAQSITVHVFLALSPTGASVWAFKIVCSLVVRCTEEPKSTTIKKWISSFHLFCLFLYHECQFCKLLGRLINVLRVRKAYMTFLLQNLSFSCLYSG